eukprot:scaffold129220_cov63-Phaeocystis_antarctica.AAC.1
MPAQAKRPPRIALLSRPQLTARARQLAMVNATPACLRLSVSVFLLRRPRLCPRRRRRGAIQAERRLGARAGGGPRVARSGAPRLRPSAARSNQTATAEAAATSRRGSSKRSVARVARSAGKVIRSILAQSLSWKDGVQKGSASCQLAIGMSRNRRSSTAAGGGAAARSAATRVASGVRTARAISPTEISPSPSASIASSSPSLAAESGISASGRHATTSSSNAGSDMREFDKSAAGQLGASSKASASELRTRPTASTPAPPAAPP